MLLGRIGRLCHDRTGFDWKSVKLGAIFVTKDNRIEGRRAAASTAAGRAAGRGLRLLQEGSRRDFIESLKRRVSAVVVKVDRAVEVIDNDLFADRHRLEGNLAFTAACKHSAVHVDGSQIEIAVSHAVCDDNITVHVDIFEVNARNTDHHRTAFGNLRIIAGSIDIQLKDIVERLCKLGTGDIILRSERAVRIAVDIALFDHADNTVFRPRADFVGIGKSGKCLFVRTRNAEHSCQNKEHLLTGYVRIRVKRGIACTVNSTHLICLGNRLIEPIVGVHIGDLRKIRRSGCAEGTCDKGSEFCAGKRLIGLDKLAFVADIKSVFDGGGHGIL